MIIPPMVFSSAGAGSINTLSANGLMFIVIFIYTLYIIELSCFACSAKHNDLNENRAKPWENKYWQISSAKMALFDKRVE